MVPAKPHSCTFFWAGCNPLPARSRWNNNRLPPFPAAPWPASWGWCHSKKGRFSSLAFASSDLTIARQALEEVGIGHLERRMLSTLSGGERQLAIIARALAQQPHILLLDEPTAHLDLSYQGRLLQVLSDLAGHGVTVLFTTHDPNAAASVADYLVLMAQGQIKAAGRLPEVLNAALLSDTYGVGIEVISLAGRPYVRRLEWPRG
jgi:ABC-type cobalamin/Fe3+-siderophores transport system ATPase subunit